MATELRTFVDTDVLIDIARKNMRDRLSGLLHCDSSPPIRLPSPDAKYEALQGYSRPKDHAPLVCRVEERGRVSFDFIRSDREAMVIIEDRLPETPVNLKVADDAALEIKMGQAAILKN